MPGGGEGSGEALWATYSIVHGRAPVGKGIECGFEAMSLRGLSAESSRLALASGVVGSLGNG
jgi:hypothetical protein